MKKELYYDLGDDEYIYEVDYKEIYSFLENQFAKDYGLKLNLARDIISDLYLDDILEEHYREEILENWHEEAMKQRDEGKMSKYSLYGLSESDFH